MVLDLEEGMLIDVFGSLDVGGRRDVTLSWASKRIDLRQWVFQMPARLGFAKETEWGAFPTLMASAWRAAKAHTSEADKRALVLMGACWDRFDGSKNVQAEDGSAPFDRQGCTFIDIDLTSRNEALTLMEQIREALPCDNQYPLALSPSGDGVKLFVPVAIGKGVPWNTASRSTFCQAVWEGLLGDLARKTPIDIKGTATSRAYLSGDILHELVGTTGRLVLPVILEASQTIDSVFGEKKTAGEFPNVTRWRLTTCSSETFQQVVQFQLAAVASSRRLTGKDDIISLAQSMGTFLEDNNPGFNNDGVPEGILSPCHLETLTEPQRAAIQKTGAGLFLRQIVGMMSVLRFVISSRRWGADAPRSVRLASHALSLCDIDIHPSQVDNLLKKLVKVGVLEKTREPRRGRSPAWYQLAGSALDDFEAFQTEAPLQLEAPKDGEWNRTLIRRVWLFSTAQSWLDHVQGLQGINAKTDRLRKCVMIWNWMARKRNLELIESLIRQPD